MFMQLFLYLCHLVKCLVCDKISLVYLIVNHGLQVLETHEIVRLLAPLVESQCHMIVDIAHQVDLLLVLRLGINW